MSHRLRLVAFSISSKHSVTAQNSADGWKEICVGELDVVAAGGPVADFPQFFAVGEPEGHLFDGGVLEVGG